MDQSEIVVPAYNLPNVFKLRDKLSDSLVAHVGTTPQGPEFERFVDDVYENLPGDLKYSVIYESLVYLISKEITEKDLYTLSWRFAANLNQLRAGIVVTPWQAQVSKEWVPVQVLTAQQTITPKGDLGYTYQIRVLAGSCAPIILVKTWPIKICNYIASKIGFSKPWKDTPYKDGHELVSMRFFVEIDPKLCRGEPGFEHVYCTGSLERWNKELLKARAHLDPPCPMNFSHPCYKCPVGYDQCKAGVHPRTYIAKQCNICNKETWHDPGPIEICVSCRDSIRRTR